MRLKGVGLVGVASVLLLSAARGASAQPAPPQVNQNCTVSVLNRTVTANPDGTWILPNVPANFGPVRARVTCIVDGQTISGESDPFTVPANGAVNIPQIRFGQTTPIPTALTVSAPTGPLTQAGETLQLSVTAFYSNNSTRDVTPASAGTTYTVSNPAIATITGDGLLQAVSSGTVIVQATHEGASGMRAFQIALAGTDTDGDGIPDDIELQLGMNPNNPVDAMEDFDRDNLTNLQEYQLGTDMRKGDTDGDGLKDGDEMTRGTGPLIRDTDGDGLSDGLEVQTSSNPLDPNSFNLAEALSAISVTPAIFNVTFNTIAGDSSVQLQVRGTLRDGATLDLTSTQRGTNYASSDRTICSFGATPGRVFAGVSGGCTVTATVGGFSAVATGTVTTFAPTPLSGVDLGGPGNGVDVAGDFVYVAAGGAGLKVVDVINRSAPRVAATLALPGTANDVKLAGTKAFVAAGAAGLHVVDISNPLVPRLLGSVDTPGDATDVRARGTTAYVADGAGGLQVIDVSVPTAPRIVGAVATAGAASGVDLGESLAVVAVRGAGVQIVNVANPASPVVIGAVDTPGDALDVVVKGSYAYVADFAGSLRAINISTPTAPALGGTTSQDLGGVPVDLAVVDQFVLGTDVSFTFLGVPIVDVSEFANLRPRAILNFGGGGDSLGIAVDGSHVYLGTNTNRLHIGQFRIQQDLNGIPPSVSIVAPANGATVVEGEGVTVTVAATDDLGVAGVTFIVNGVAVATDTTAPYQFTITAPTGGATTIQLGATAGDLGNNIGVAESIVINVIPDPLTTVEGRVVDHDGLPVVGATVTCGAGTGVTLGDGTFSLAGLPTVRPVVQCTARFVAPDTTIFGGRSAPVPAARGDITVMGDIVVEPVPIVASISPKVIDVALAPPTLRVTGSNLAGATFGFVPELSAISVTSAVIDPGGASATLAITVSASARGRFTLVGSNSLGVGDTTPTPGNSVTIINAGDVVDSDGDGFPDGLELLYGSDPALASSRPNLSVRGDAQGEFFAVVNRLFPSTFVTAREAQSASFAVVNRLFPSTFVTAREAQSASFAVVNRLFPSTFVTAREAQSAAFAVVNRLFPSTFVTTREAQSASFAVVNRLFPSTFVTAREAHSAAFTVVNRSIPLLFTTTPVELKSHWFSVRNDPAAIQQLSSQQTQASQLGAGGTDATQVAELPRVSLVSLTPADGSLVEGQTVVIRADVAGIQADSVEFSVNDTVLKVDTTAPYEWLFTVPAGVSSVALQAVVSNATSRVAATPVIVPVQPDSSITITGRVVDLAGNPVQEATVAILSEGVDAELFDFTTPLSALPDVTGRSPNRVTRLTAINMRNPGGVFGGDPIGSRLVPDYVGRLTGWLSIAAPGTHTLVLGASDGARLTVGGITVVDMAAGTGEYWEESGAMALRAGLVPFEVSFYQGVGNGDLQLSIVAPDGGGVRTVSPSMLAPSDRALTVRTDAVGRFTIRNVPTALASVQVLATPVGGSRSGSSSLFVPAPRADADVGDVIIPAP